MPSIYSLYCNSYGGFELSQEVRDIFQERYPEKKYSEYNREDEYIINIVKEIGFKRSSTRYCKLEMVVINFDVKISLDDIKSGINVHEYDGIETVGIDTKAILYRMIKRKMFSNVEEIYEMMELLEKVECVDYVWQTDIEDES